MNNISNLEIRTIKEKEIKEFGSLLFHLEIRTIKEKEIKEFGSLLFQIFPNYFQSSLENCIQWITSLGKQNIIIARKNRKIVGGLTLIRMGQWFGGSVVPVNGIAVAGVYTDT